MGKHKYNKTYNNIQCILISLFDRVIDHKNRIYHNFKSSNLYAM